ncbi:MAG: dihydrofolate reductase family protein [Candidatus Micrarchaeota archaeon]
MRKIFLNMGLSIDGFFEGPDHDISWHKFDDEVNRFELKMLRSADLFIFGRRMYQLMEDAWPKMAKDPALSKENKEIAYLINNTPKIVVSRTLKSVEEKENWKNITLMHEFDPDEIRRLKELPGKDICVGGSELAVSFVKEGLIDEFWFMVNPVVLGKGTPILAGLEQRLNLQLVKTKRFKSGNMLLHYRRC